MTLRVIGAGFGRTGTESMKLALEALGFAPCHHMKEVHADPEQTRLWRERVTRPIGDPDAPGWDALLAGFEASVDWPSAFYWRELAEAHPEAKILLTVRDSPETWWRSFSKTILPFMRAARADPSLPQMGTMLLWDQVFGGRAEDAEHAMAVYSRANEAVVAEVPADRLLVFTTGDGWAPLCRFLDLPAPSIPFPSANSAEAFQEMMARYQDKS